jgi:hypothetical protein
MTRNMRKRLRVQPSYGFKHADCSMQPPPGVDAAKQLQFELQLVNWYSAKQVSSELQRLLWLAGWLADTLHCQSGGALAVARLGRLSSCCCRHCCVLLLPLLLVAPAGAHPW